MTKLFSFLGGFTPRFYLIAGGVLLVIVAIVMYSCAERADDRSNQQIGATVERERATTEVLQRTEKANEVREQTTRDLRSDDGRSDVAYRQCLRSARTPANCERLLPGGQADQR